MKKFLLKLMKFLFIFTAIVGLAYGGLVFISHPGSEPTREYPAWENYYSEYYWLSDWIKLLNQHKKNKASQDSDCVVTSSIKRFGIIPVTTEICIWSATETSWARKVWGMPVATRQWNGFIDFDGKLKNNNYGEDFPHGPYTVYTPKKFSDRDIYERKLTDDEIVEAFLKLALELESDPFGNNIKNQPITKWVDPIRLVVDDFSENQFFQGKPLIEWVDDFIEEIKILTGLHIQRFDREELQDQAANFVVVFLYQSQREQFLEFMNNLQKKDSDHDIQSGYFMSKAEVTQKLWRKDSHCFATGRVHDNKILQDVVFIILDQAEPLGCIQEEISQGLGIMNDAREVEPTMFNDHSPYRNLTGLDKVLLHILYDKRIQVGMNKDEVYPVVKSIVKELRAAGNLEHIKGQFFNF